MNNQSKYAPSEDELAFAAASSPTTPESLHRKTSKFDPNEDELAFAKGSEGFVDNERSNFHKLKSYASAGLKGILKGTNALVSSVGVQKIDSDFNKQAELEDFEQGLDELLPTDEGAVERYIERGGKNVPAAFGAIASGSPALLTAGGAAAGTVLGQTAEEIGLPEPIPTILDVLPGGLSGLAKGKIPPKNAEQKSMLALGTKFGIKEKDLAPGLVPPEGLRKYLAKFAWKGESVQERIKQSKAALGTIYEGLKKSPEALKSLNPKYIPDFAKEMKLVLKELHPSLREKVMKPLSELKKSKGTGEDFIRFYQHANQEVADPTKIGNLQALIRETLTKVDPVLGEEFGLANKLYTNVNRTGHALKAPAIDMLMLTKAGGALYGLYTGDYTLMAASMGSIAARRLATSFLMDPKLQNLHAKFVTALNNGRNYLAVKTLQEFRTAVKDEAPEFYEQTKDIDVDQLIRAKKGQNDEKK